MAGNQLIICYIIWADKYTHETFQSSFPRLHIEFTFFPFKNDTRKRFLLLWVNLFDKYLIRKYVCSMRGGAVCIILSNATDAVCTTYVQLLLLATLQFCQNHWASNISFSTRTEMKLRVCAFLLCFLVMVKAMPQFSEKQVESLAFIRLNPCERAIWR